MIYAEGLPVTGEDPVDFSLGGAETAVVSMARALAKRGHQVTVYANTPTPGRVANVEYRPSTEVGINFDATGCDIFLSCRAHDVVSRVRGSRAVGLWCHDPADSGTIGLLRQGLCQAGFVLFLSEFQHRQFAKHVHGLSPFARVTTNGVDHNRIDQVRLEHSPGSGPPKFIYGARPIRGLEFLLTEIWPRIESVFPGAELLLAGYDMRALCDGDAPRLERNREWNHYFAEMARNKPGVRLLGSLSRRRFWETMAECKVVLYPTETPEVNCMVALEAQALGVPMVTTDDFALRETLGFAPTRMKTLWGTAEYVAEFVATAVKLIENPEFFREARTAGLAHVSRETHSWDAIAEKWEELFHEELSRSTAPKKSPKLSALILVRRGQETLRACLKSLGGVADEVLIGDARPTGVREGEPLLIAPIAGCRVIPIEFLDCAQAWNDLARHAVGEYLLSMNADEILVNPGLLRAAIDDNVFFDAFRIECFAVNTVRQLPAVVRCFRQHTPEGRLKWIGCCYESVEHEVNCPPLRCRDLPEVSIRVENDGTALFRGCFDEAEAVRLMKRDQHQNPGRTGGYLMRMLHSLALAERELSGKQGITSLAHRCLNNCVEIWAKEGGSWSGMDRETGFQLSREALALLAKFGGRLRLTRRSPLEGSYSVTLQRGARCAPACAAGSLFFIDATEMQQYLCEMIAKASPALEEQPQFPPALMLESGGALTQ